MSMDTPSLFDKIIAELKMKLENDENFEQTLTNEVIVLLQEEELNPDNMIHLIKSYTKKNIEE